MFEQFDPRGKTSRFYVRNIILFEFWLEHRLTRLMLSVLLQSFSMNTMETAVNSATTI
jgi:hypothetical protein